jgi:hypothetical protein
LRCLVHHNIAALTASSKFEQWGVCPMNVK